MTLLTTFFNPTAYAQKTDVFQQEVNYKIKVIYNDTLGRVDGDFLIHYKNNSSQALPYIIFHLWANAYSDRSSAFSEQMMNLGHRDFYHAREHDLGGYQEVEFKADSMELQVTPYEGHVDVVKVQLPRPLEPGHAADLTGKFKLKIPKSFSRMGRDDQSVQLTQWYPKPAVFDRDGWHPMPYLHLGEYYAEWGRYDVTLTLPSEYVVAATGRLTDSRERALYEEMALQGTTYPDLARPLKTLHYWAENVHDFALFMDKRFMIEKAPILLGKKEITAWSYYLPEHRSTWSGSAEMASRAVRYAVKNIGDYPYSQVSIVDGNLSVGGGMEYPMVTVIGNIKDKETLDRVIAHEVFHNWFQGMLASNEREFPWLDEGPTSYFEHRYMMDHYPDLPARREVLPTNYSGWTESGLAYMYEVGRGQDLPCNLHSRDYDELAYGVSAYAKPTLAFQLLEKSFGRASLTRAFQEYYQQYHHRHVSPDDMQRVFERVLGTDLSWWFDDVIGSRKVLDYKLCSARRIGDQWNVRMKNVGQINAPVTLFNDRGDHWVLPGFEGTKNITFSASDSIRRWYLDDSESGMDAHPQNNFYRTHGWLRRIEPPALRFLPGVPAPYKTDIYVYPVVGWNLYDKWMAGVHWTNLGLLPRRFNYSLTPMYSFDQKTISGQGEVYYNFFPSSLHRPRWQVGIAAKKYHIRDILLTDQDVWRAQLHPFIKYRWYNAGIPLTSKELTLESFHHWERNPTYADGRFAGFASPKEFSFYRLSFDVKRRTGWSPWAVNTQLEYSKFRPVEEWAHQEYLRWTLEGRRDVYYLEKRKVSMRLFVGYFLFNDARDRNSINSVFAPRSLGLVEEGHTDYFEDTYLGRYASRGVLSRQIGQGYGGFKVATTLPYASQIGHSNDGIVSLNLAANLPVRGMVGEMARLFFDVGYFSDRSNPVVSNPSFSDQLIWSSGFSIHLIKDMVQVHFPLVQSRNLTEVLKQAGQDEIWERVTFTLKLRPGMLVDLLEETRLVL